MDAGEVIDPQTGEITDYSALPPKVAAAITAVMGEVPRLEKGEKNSHGNYNFASIDDFLEAVRPLCAKHGLIIMQDEESFDMRDGWLVMRFRFTLAHSSGETWGHRPTRTIMVSSKMGAQAFGAAQSYALKQFERSLFQIATGEKGADADEHPAANLPNGNGRTTGRTAPRPTLPPQTNGNGARPEKPEEIVPAKNRDGYDFQPWARRVAECIKTAPSAEWLADFMAANQGWLEKLKAESETAYDNIIRRCNARADALRNGEPGPLDGG